MRREMLGLGMVLMSGLVAGAERHKGDAAEAPIQVEGNDLEANVRCHNNAVHIVGNGSHLTIEGDCTTVYVEGNRNWLEVQYADWIKTTGNLNSVLTLNPGTRSVDSGKANTIAPKWQQ